MRTETRENLWALLGIVGFILVCLFMVWIVWPSDADAATCTPLPTCGDPGVTTPCATPTPTIQGDHDRSNTVLYRVYAQLEGDTSWPWHFDIPYHAADADSAEAAPVILQPWPIDRVVPTNIEFQNVRVMVKAVSATNVESAPSNIVTVCMSHKWVKPEAWQ